MADELMFLDGQIRYQGSDFWFGIEDLIYEDFPSEGQCSVRELKAVLKNIAEGSYLVNIAAAYWFSLVKSDHGFEIFNVHATGEDPTSIPDKEQAAILQTTSAKQAAHILKVNGLRRKKHKFVASTLVTR